MDRRAAGRRAPPRSAPGLARHRPGTSAPRCGCCAATPAPATYDAALTGFLICGHRVRPRSVLGRKRPRAQRFTESTGEQPRVPWPREPRAPDREHAVPARWGSGRGNTPAVAPQISRETMHARRGRRGTRSPPGTRDPPAGQSPPATAPGMPTDLRTDRWLRDWLSDQNGGCLPCPGPPGVRGRGIGAMAG